MGSLWIKVFTKCDKCKCGHQVLILLSSRCLTTVYFYFIKGTTRKYLFKVLLLLKIRDVCSTFRKCKNYSCLLAGVLWTGVLYLPRRDTFISSPWPVGYLWTYAPLSCSTQQPLQTVTEKWGGSIKQSHHNTSGVCLQRHQSHANITTNHVLQLSQFRLVQCLRRKGRSSLSMFGSCEKKYMTSLTVKVWSPNPRSETQDPFLPNCCSQMLHLDVEHFWRPKWAEPAVAPG